MVAGTGRQAGMEILSCTIRMQIIYGMECIIPIDVVVVVVGNFFSIWPWINWINYNTDDAQNINTHGGIRTCPRIALGERHTERDTLRYGRRAMQKCSCTVVDLMNLQGTYREWGKKESASVVVGYYIASRCRALIGSWLQKTIFLTYLAMASFHCHRLLSRSIRLHLLNCSRDAGMLRTRI